MQKDGYLGHIIKKCCSDIMDRVSLNTFWCRNCNELIQISKPDAINTWFAVEYYLPETYERVLLYSSFGVLTDSMDLPFTFGYWKGVEMVGEHQNISVRAIKHLWHCLLYTSDAADE